MKKFLYIFPLALAVMTTGTLGALAADHSVSIIGFKFVPANLTVSAGDTVTFINNDGAPHTATGSGFNTGTLGKGQSGTITISAAGTYEYKCNFHQAMKGTITAN